MSFWSKWFGRSLAADRDNAVEVSHPADTLPATPGRKPGWLARLKPESQRDRQIAWLQAGYSEMLGLMRGIRDHLDRQEDIQHKLAGVLERLPESMDNLKSLGKAAEQQTETLGFLRQQMEAGIKHDQQLIESMNRFNATLGVMDQTTRASSKTVADLIEKSRGTETLLRDLMVRSERRVALIISVFLFVVVFGFGLLAYVVFFNPALLQPKSARELISPPTPTPTPATTTGPLMEVLSIALVTNETATLGADDAAAASQAVEQLILLPVISGPDRETAAPPAAVAAEPPPAAAADIPPSDTPPQSAPETPPPDAAPTTADAPALGPALAAPEATAP